MNVVRTVLGDVPSGQLGVCYAHEHLVIDGGVAKIINPEISLQRVDDAVDELGPCVAAGLGAVVDAMPADAGRNVAKLAAISRRSGVHVVAATGLHHARYYGERHWGELLEPPEMAELFAGELEHGIDAHDLNGPVLRRTPHRAGVVKVAGSAGGPSARDRRVFEAAAIAVAGVGAAVLTHCEGGTGAAAQLRLLDDLGVPLDRVILSHTDKVVDRGYHRELLATGAYVVYDQGIRSPEDTARLVRWMVEDGHERQLLLGTDGARRSLWTVLGGSPGLAALRTHLGKRLADELGPAVMERIWVANPAAALELRPGTAGAYEASTPTGRRRNDPAQGEGLRRHRGDRHGRRRGAPVRRRGRRGLGRRPRPRPVPGPRPAVRGRRPPRRGARPRRPSRRCGARTRGSTPCTRWPGAAGGGWATGPCTSSRCRPGRAPSR